MEVQKIPCISTCHMPDSMALERLDVPKALYEYGGFVYLDPEDATDWFYHLREVIQAKDPEVFWVRFDRDADPLTGLRQYDW